MSDFRKYNFGRRIPQYIIGLICMAVGLVLLKRTYWGISPISAVPDAVANITPLTLGNTTIFLHIICVIAQIIIVKRVTVKAILTAFVGIPFGYLVDLVMFLINPVSLSVPMKLVFLVVGIAIQGFGVLTIVCSDLMLPAPDELNHAISDTFGIPLGKVKVFADAIYVIIAIIINLAAALAGGGTGFLNDIRESGILTAIGGLLTAKYLASVGIATFASVFLTGRFITWFGKAFPKLKMDPFWNNKK